MRTLAAFTVLIMGGTLAGCMGSTPTTPAARFKGLESAHQPVVSRTVLAFDIATSGSNGLAAGEYQRLRDWFDGLQLSYADRISIDASSTDGEAAVREAVGVVAARYGMLVSEGAPVTNGTPSPGYARVIVSRAKAEVPGCPDWSGSPIGNAPRLPNYGCGVNGTLAAMVANPEDLLSGRTGDTSIDATSNSKAIKTYRDKPATGSADVKTEATGNN